MYVDQAFSDAMFKEHNDFGLDTKSAAETKRFLGEVFGFKYSNPKRSICDMARDEEHGHVSREMLVKATFDLLKRLDAECTELPADGLKKYNKELRDNFDKHSKPGKCDACGVQMINRVASSDSEYIPETAMMTLICSHTSCFECFRKARGCAVLRV